MLNMVSTVLFYQYSYNRLEIKGITIWQCVKKSLKTQISGAVFQPQ